MNWGDTLSAEIQRAPEMVFFSVLLGLVLGLAVLVLLYPRYRDFMAWASKATPQKLLLFQLGWWTFCIFLSWFLWSVGLLNKLFAVLLALLPVITIAVHEAYKDYQRQRTRAEAPAIPEPEPPTLKPNVEDRLNQILDKNKR